MKITLINANTDLGTNVDGSEEGPLVISQHFVNNSHINDIINIDKPQVKKSHDPNDLAKNMDAINEFNTKLYKAIYKCKNDHNFPIILGGDHSLAIASALGSIKTSNNLGIIWIDSHLDYNTFITTITGNIHGLPLASINGLNKELSLFHDGNYYNPLNTVIVGYRSQEENKDQELNNIKNMHVTVFTTDDIHKLGIKKVMQEAFAIASNNTNGLHISYDLDVIDPTIAPGVSIKEENGITEEEAFMILDEVLQREKLIQSFDLVEFNPRNDINQKTEAIAVKIVNKIINSKL